MYGHCWSRSFGQLGKGKIKVSYLSAAAAVWKPMTTLLYIYSSTVVASKTNGFQGRFARD